MPWYKCLYTLYLLSEASATMTSSSDTPGQTGKKAGCSQCQQAAPLGFDFTFAYQPIVDLSTRSDRKSVV